MNSTESEKKVLVQVVPADEGREIGWGETTAEQLRNRLEDIHSAIKEGAKAVADSLEGLPDAKGWRLGEASAKFGVTLTAQAGVILSSATAGATFEVTVTYQHDHQ